MNQTSKQPLVSCLCITWKKVSKLERAIECFKAQTYPNKELIIVYEDHDTDTVKFLENFDEPDIICHKQSSSPKLTLGDLRNLSISLSNGEYFCQWDDDDFYHQDRVRIQMNHLLSNHHPVGMLTSWLIYDDVKKQAYFSSFRLWEGSIVCLKKEVAETLSYPSEKRGEDTEFVNKLLIQSRVLPIVVPNLYIYVYHGSNTWHAEHFEILLSCSQKLSGEVSDLIGSILEGKYSVKEASELLDSHLLLQEVDYFARKKKPKAVLN